MMQKKIENNREESSFSFVLILGLVWTVSHFAGFHEANAQSLDHNTGAIELPDPQSRTDLKQQPGIQVSENSARGNQPRVGRRAASKYMGVTPNANGDSSENNSTAPSRSAASTSSDHYLSLHIGTYLGDQAYNWGGRSGATEVGEMNLGFTYRVGEWINSMDLALRVDYSSFDLAEGRASKLSFLPLLMLPDASSRFPFYFGTGLGLGAFLQQIPGESSLALDYQLLVGLRFFELGFFIESGLKSHVFLASPGQFNGTFVSAGSVFTF